MKRSVKKILSDIKIVIKNLTQLQKDLQKELDTNNHMDKDLEDAISDTECYCGDALYLLETGEEAIENAIQSDK